MPTTLTSTQVERYTRDGFLSPNTALTRAGDSDRDDQGADWCWPG